MQFMIIFYRWLLVKHILIKVFLIEYFFLILYLVSNGARHYYLQGKILPKHLKRYLHIKSINHIIVIAYPTNIA